MTLVREKSIGVEKIVRLLIKIKLLILVFHGHTSLVDLPTEQFGRSAFIRFRLDYQCEIIATVLISNPGCGCVESLPIILEECSSKSGYDLITRLHANPVCYKTWTIIRHSEIEKLPTKIVVEFDAASRCLCISVFLFVDFLLFSNKNRTKSSWQFSKRFSNKNFML